MAGKGNSGIGFFGLLFITFLVLKLTSVVAWSWWWVFAPLWGPLAFNAALFGAVFLEATVWKALSRWFT